ncbi:hypothetical protein B0O80DRAFT_448488 [Mortierella sp. GBAus27b]|nr:hypothetical protein B0O80DRAFT_448488 [Mortierella sp. GBAus27b]
MPMDYAHEYTKAKPLYISRISSHLQQLPTHLHNFQPTSPLHILQSIPSRTIQTHYIVPKLWNVRHNVAAYDSY